MNAVVWGLRMKMLQEGSKSPQKITTTNAYLLYFTLSCLAAACANLLCKLYAAVFCEPPPPKPSKNDIASSATMIDFKSSLPDCGGEGDEKNIEMSTDCFLCKKCLFTFVPCRMDVTLKKSVLEMGIPLQSSPPHYYSLGV